MDFSSINWLAVAIATIVSMVIGAVWYNPKTFFIAWWRAMGKGEYDPENPGDMGGNPAMTWGLTIVSAFVRALFLAAILAGLGADTLFAGAATGFLLWLGIAAPTTLINKLFADHFQSWFIETGDHLVTFVVVGAILGAWA